MKISTVYAMLALVSGGALFAPAANAETWVMWDGNTPAYVQYVETPTQIMKDITKPVVIQDQTFTKAVILQRDIAVPRWMMTNQQLNYEAAEVLRQVKKSSVSN